jgi:hypothetical protein
VKRSVINGLISTALIVTSGIGSALLAPTPAGAAAPRATKVAISSRNVDFGFQRVGTAGRLLGVKIRNTGTTPLTLNRISFQSGNRTDFIVGTGCFPSGLHNHPVTLAPGAACSVAARFVPRARTARVAILRIDDSAPDSPQTVRLHGVGTQGYYLAGVQGGVATFGDARFHGDLLNYTLAAPIISLTITPNGAGYWLLGTDGGIFSFGNAKFFGSTGAMRLAAPALGMAPTPNGQGYWLVAGDGGIFSFGNAKFFGSTGAMRLNQPVVGMASTPSGKGYWLVAADGGIFTFGDARYFGSTGGGAFGLMTGMTITSDGGGYWLSNTAGQVFPFGNAPYFGDIYRRHRSVLAAVAASAPKLRPPGFAGTVLYLKHGAQNAAMLPHAVPRLDGG